MNRQAVILLILFIAATNLVFAQKFTPGYYVRNSGDTVHANLFLRTKKGHILGILSESGRLTSAREISAARVGNVTYVVKVVSIDKSPKVASATDTVFLEVMSREKMSLLYSIDENDKAHYFIEDENGTTEELGLRILDRGDGITFQELTTYKDKLKSLFPGCSMLYGDIDRTRYTKAGIQSTYEKLYECKYGAPPKTEPIKDVVSDYGLLIGISMTDLSFEDVGNGNIASSVMWDRSIDITGGVFMETRFAKTGPAFSLRQELTHRRYRSSSTDYYKGQGQVHILGNVSASYIKYSLMARYAISQNKLKPFINAGVSPSVLLSSSSRAVISTGFTQGNDVLLGKTSIFEFGFFGSAGLLYENLSLEVRVEQSSGLNPKYYNSSVHTLYILLSYRLFQGNQ
jgi:hypothetical protein